MADPGVAGLHQLHGINVSGAVFELSHLFRLCPGHELCDRRSGECELHPENVRVRCSRLSRLLRYRA